MPLFKYIRGKQIEIGSQLYMFDLDGTLITTKSGSTFPKNKNDYEYLMIPKCDSDAVMVIYTNQYKVDMEEFEEKLFEIMDHIISVNSGNLMIIAFVATEKDSSRKPLPFGLFNDGILEGIEKLAYIGDAAGRKNDHSDTDYKFLLNISKLSGIRGASIKCHFYTPEEYIESGLTLNSDVVKCANERRLISINYPKFSHYGFPSVINNCVGHDLIICCGRQGSGKTTTINELENAGYEVVIYTSKNSTLNNVKRKLLTGSKIIVDGTFPTEKVRAEFIDIANKPLIISFNTSELVCKHNRTFREIFLGAAKIPSVAIRKFNDLFEEPSEDECDILEIINNSIRIHNHSEYQLYYY